MRKIILLFSPLTDEQTQMPNLPFALLNLERMIRDLDIEVVLIDEKINRKYTQIIDQYKDRLLIVGISVMIGYQMISAIKCSKYVKENTPAKILWGGWLPNVVPELALIEDYVDFIIQGQGEIPFQNFIRALLEEKDFTKIKGLGYKSGSQIFINPRDFMVDEKTLPKLDFSKIDVEKIIEINGKPGDGYRSINYIATMGCHYNCTFCCLASVWEQKTSTKDLSTIIDDLLFLTQNHGIAKVSFDDDHFFGNKTFVINLCNAILGNNIHIKWEANAHISSIIKKYSNLDIQLLYKAGCRAIRFGVESGDKEVLLRINKNLNVEDSLRVAKLLYKNNIKCVFQAMLAFPWNPERDFKLTLNMISQAKLSNPDLEAMISFFIPLPKTPLMEEAISYGFKPLRTMDQIIAFILKDYYAPWWTKNYKNEVRDYFYFYFKYADPYHYKTKDLKIRLLDKFINKLAFPICWLRLKFNFRSFRIEAKIYFFLKYYFNRLTENRYANINESKCRIIKTPHWDP